MEYWRPVSPTSLERAGIGSLGGTVLYDLLRPFEGGTVTRERDGNLGGWIALRCIVLNNSTQCCNTCLRYRYTNSIVCSLSLALATTTSPTAAVSHPTAVTSPTAMASHCRHLFHCHCHHSSHCHGLSPQLPSIVT